MHFNRIGLRVSVDGKEIAAIRCDRAVIKIGRISSAQVLLDDPSVSRMHAIVETDPTRIIDLGSTSGTLVNGERITTRNLVAGDRITIGVFTLAVAAAADLERGAWTDAPFAWRREPVVPAASTAAITRLMPRKRRRLGGGLPPQLAYLEELGARAEPVPLVATPDPAAVAAAEPKEREGLLAALGDPEQRAGIMGMLAMIAKDDRAFADQVSLLMMVGIDQLRAHRGMTDDLGVAYAAVIDGLAVMCMPRTAPSLLIELAYGLPASRDGRPCFAASIAQHDASWPYLMLLANLPGFARDCAVAAVTAGRDPKPWLAHPFGDVRAAAAQVIRDPAERQRACASVWTSYAASDMKPRFDWREAYEAETEPLHDLPPIGQLVDGLFSDCADHRAWTIERVAARRDPRDAYALAVADELDTARAQAGWPRTRVDWARWEGVPVDPTARARWLRERGDLPDVVRAQLVYASRQYNAPRLDLSPDAYEAVLDNERCEALAALAALEARERGAAAG